MEFNSGKFKSPYGNQALPEPKVEGKGVLRGSDL